MKAVILAAGESSRFKPLSDNRHKSLIRIAGKPVIQHTIDQLEENGINEIIIVQSPRKQIEKELGDKPNYVIQEEPNGMGDALKQAERYLNDEFLVLTPFRSNLDEFFKNLGNLEQKTTLFASETDKPEKYGIIEFEGDKASKIVEKPNPEEAPSSWKVVGVYKLDIEFFKYLDQVESHEYAFEDALTMMLGEKPAEVIRLENSTSSLKYPWDLFDVTQEILDSQKRSISDEAEISDSAVLKGKVVVEKDAQILENAVIKGPAFIGENAMVGNNTLVREYSVIEQGSTVGATTELKNSILQPNTSIHSGFLGDSAVGRNTKIGAGTITANRKFREDGERPSLESNLLEKNYEKELDRSYLGAFIGDNVDIGVNVSIMPGVQIGSDSCIGPGTLVTKNVGRGENLYVNQQKVED